MTDPCQAELEAVVDADVALVIAQVNKLVADVNLYVCRQENPPAPPPGFEEPQPADVSTVTPLSNDLPKRSKIVAFAMCVLITDRCKALKKKLTPKAGSLAAAVCRQEYRHLRDVFDAMRNM